MSKIDIIDYCGDCSQRFYIGNEMKCEKTDRVTHENNSIPSWCPLQDAAEPTVQADTARQKGFKMDKDRTEICRIISEMLDNPDKCGIYPTSTAYTRLEHYVEGVRAEAIGWMHAEACVTLDRGGDPRAVEVPSILERAKVDLA